jgi:hypothetical protein
MHAQGKEGRTSIRIETDGGAMAHYVDDLCQFHHMMGEESHWDREKFTVPGLNGYEVARRIRELSGDRSRPVLVALIEWGQDEDRRERRAGAYCLSDQKWPSDCSCHL